MSDRDYVLGSHDDELYGLGLQHRVWRARVLNAWRRAGIREGAKVIDCGAGPGFATLDLAEMWAQRARSTRLSGHNDFSKCWRRKQRRGR